MKKWKKILLSVTAFFALIFITAAVLTTVKPELFKSLIKSDDEKVVISAQEKQEDYTEIITLEGETKTPLHTTDKQGLLFTVDFSGLVTYYRYSDGLLSEYDGKVKTVELKVKCSSQTIPVKIYYVEIDGSITGYGLFTNEQTDSVNYYEYAFFRLTDMPGAYTKYKTPLLLVDFDKNNLYSVNKTYADAYSVDLSSKKISRIINQRDRTVDANGVYRNDWYVIDDASISTLKKFPIHLTSRNYTIDTENKMDIYKISGTSSSKIKTGILTTYIRESAGKLYFLRKTSDGFNLVSYASEESVIKKFTGSFENDFILSEDWLMDKRSKTMTNLISGKEIKIKCPELLLIDYFYVNAPADKVTMAYNSTTQVLVKYDINSGAYSIYAGDDLFIPGIIDFCYVDDYTLLHTRYSTQDSFIYNFTKN